METPTPYTVKARQKAATFTFIPLAQEQRTHVDTAAAAYYLSRCPQTLRGWACKTGTGPLVPIRINGRLAWNILTIKQLLGVVQ